jgi:hypothetical protein
MFASKTVFVLGAGASSEVGLPLGRDLAKGISEDLDLRRDEFGKITTGNATLFDLVASRSPSEARAYDAAARAISEGILLSDPTCSELPVMGSALDLSF